MRFVKKGDEWRVVEPVDGKADQDAISSALGKIEELEVTGVAATQKKNHARLEVDEAKGTHVVAKGGGKVLLDGFVGTYQSGNSMFRVQGQEPVATVRGSIRYAFNKRLAEWRDRTITKYEPDDVQEIVFDNKNGHFQFARTGPEEFKQVLGKGEKAIAPLDMPKVRGLVGTAAGVTALDIARRRDRGASRPRRGRGDPLIKLTGGDAGAAKAGALPDRRQEGRELLRAARRGRHHLRGLDLDWQSPRARPRDLREEGAREGRRGPRARGLTEQPDPGRAQDAQMMPALPAGHPCSLSG